MFGLFFGLIAGLVGGITTEQIVTRTFPNEGIRRSLRNALISLLTSCLAIALFVGSIVWPSIGLDWPTLSIDEAHWISIAERSFGVGLVYGLVVGLVVGLRNGGFAYLAHYALRLLLWRNDYAPWNYIRFLDHAAERVFLRKVGGGYIFTHRLLMEYFATLQPADHAGSTKLG